VFGDLVTRFSKILRSHGSICKPTDRIPPWERTEGFTQSVSFDIRVSLEKVLVDLAPFALINDHGNAYRSVRAYNRLDNWRNLNVWKLLLAVLVANTVCGGCKIGLAIRVAVLEVGKLGDLGCVPIVVALAVQRTVVSRFGRNHIYDVNTAVDMLGLDRYVFVFTCVTKSLYVTGASRRIIFSPRLYFTACGHV